MYKVNKKHKDTLFRKLFEDKKELLSLYNAVNGTHYNNEEELEINTLENVLYMKMKNDVSFLFDFSLNLYEHQSTYNPNLPLRDLFYISDLLKSHMREANLYSSSLVRIPTPRFVVFYNGTDWKEERKELKLSDAFLQQSDRPELELRVMMYNITEGKNPEILEHCQCLKEYMILIERIRKYAKIMEIEEAASLAVDECIEEGVLSEFLLRNKSEAIAMSIYEYDEEKHMKAERKEHYELGYRDGEKEGYCAGEKNGFLTGQQQGIQAVILVGKNFGGTKEVVAKQLEEQFTQLEQPAMEYVERYWEYGKG